MGGSLGSVRLRQFWGTAVTRVVLVGAVAAVAAAVGLGVLEYRLRTGENSLGDLLDGRKYRFLSAEAVVDAAPAWAAAQGLRTRREWVRIRIGDQGRTVGDAIPLGHSEIDQALKDAGVVIGRRGASSRVQIAAKVILEADLWGFVRRRLVHGEFGTDRENSYRVTPPSQAWDDLAEPEVMGFTDPSADVQKAAGLPPLAPAVEPTLAALDAWRAAEAALARSLGQPSLRATETAPGGASGGLAGPRQALRAAREALYPYVDARGRPGLEAWLGAEGVPRLEAALAAMAHLDLLLEVASKERRAILPLLGPYLERRIETHEALATALAKVGVLVP